MTSPFSTIEEAVDAIRQGRVVIVVDAEDRENEGDFICAAERVTPEIVNFMITHGRGQLCMPILPEVSQRLELPLMVGQNTAPLGTNYTVTVDHRSIKTGITAAERARTIQALCDPTSKPTDFTRPGHVQPLVAKEGGVLRRAGHTEAAVDLARMAGLQPAGVLCEILNESGDRANRDQLLDLARRFDLPIISIEELIAYRRVREKLVYREAEAKLPTKYGTGTIISYGVKYESQQPLVFVLGDPTKVAAPLVRLHSSCFTGDLLESLRCDCGDQLHMALDMIQNEGTGVLVYLPQEGRGIGIVEKIKAYAPAGPGARHGRSQPRPRLQSRPARLRRRHPAAERPRPAQSAAADEQPQEDRRLHLRRLRPGSGRSDPDHAAHERAQRPLSGHQARQAGPPLAEGLIFTTTTRRTRWGIRQD